MSYLAMVYITVALFFVSAVVLNHRDYQDLWMLKDILFPTAVFILTFTIVVTHLDNNKIVALICASFITLLNLMPAFKYEWFWGTEDTLRHYYLWLK